MKKYIITDELQKLIDWDNIMEMDRCAGGHDDQMKGLFMNAKVIGHWNEGDYQGMVATCVMLTDGRFVIYNDFYGSCSGCDSWECASDEDVETMCINLANGAYVFKSIEDVKIFLKDTTNENIDGNFDWFHNTACSMGLLNAIESECS